MATAATMCALFCRTSYLPESGQVQFTKQLGEPFLVGVISILVEHLPAQLRIIVATRTNPPLLLSQLRARQKVLEVRMLYTNQSKQS